jgi:hypothetical protein
MTFPQLSTPGRFRLCFLFYRIFIFNATVLFWKFMILSIFFKPSSSLVGYEIVLFCFLSVEWPETTDKKLIGSRKIVQGILYLNGVEVEYPYKLR